MAKRKKSRTPAPPKRPGARPTGAARTEDGKARQVQAPKVVTGKRRTQGEQERRARMMLYGLALSGIIGLVIALVVVFAFRGGGGGGGAPHFDGPDVNFTKLIGVRTTPPPWSSGQADLAQRLKPIGLNQLGQEGQVLHIHQHLDIYDNGKHITVPRYIGIKVDKGNVGFLTELHTHGTDGIIHLESPTANTYSLGQFFGVWGVFLSKKCVGGLCGTAAKPLKIYVNGNLVKGDPIKMVLQEHQEIAIVYGTPPSHIPSGYNWPTGL